jgi:hypothetical protein
MTTSTNFNHNSNAIDIRDKSLVYFNNVSKKFVVEASTLKAKGINQLGPSVNGATYNTIWLWSPKFKMYLKYIKTNSIKRGCRILADVFKPDSTYRNQDEIEAYAQAANIELHIIND